jgi:hypothetical protein
VIKTSENGGNFKLDYIFAPKLAFVLQLFALYRAYSVLSNELSSFRKSPPIMYLKTLN